MNKKLAIHKSSWGFSLDWISYCEKENIQYKIVNCYASDITEQIHDCDALLWHHHHSLAKDSIFAKQLLFALEQSGKKVFPEFNAGWHFDDKLGQKYLLEAIGAPMATTFAFYSKDEAINWSNTTTFPKVFKLRGGAGSANVRLVHNRKQANQLIRQAFGKGFPSYDRIGDLKENWRRLKAGKSTLFALLKSIRRLLVSTEFARQQGREKGYILFQDFIPNNLFDIRIVVIGRRAFGLKRMVRPNDFRASGSGLILYDKSEIDERCVEIAFETTVKLNASCVAYDFVFDSSNQPLMVEINYGFAHEAYFNCPGYWDDKMNWHEAKFNAAYWILEEITFSL